MRFIDPWAMFNYMGGAFSTHLGLTIFGYMTYQKHIKNFESLHPCTGFEKCPKLGIRQVHVMMMSHIFCMISMMMLKVMKKYHFIQEIMKVFVIFVYQLSMLYLQYTYFSQLNDCVADHVEFM